MATKYSREYALELALTVSLVPDVVWLKEVKLVHMIIRSNFDSGRSHADNFFCEVLGNIKL